MLGTSSFQALLPSFSSFLLSGLLFPLHFPSIPVHSSSNHPCWSPVPSSRWNLPRPSLKIHSRCSCHSEFPPPPMPALPECELSKAHVSHVSVPAAKHRAGARSGLAGWLLSALLQLRLHPKHSCTFPVKPIAHSLSPGCLHALCLSREHPHLSKTLPCLQSWVQMSCCFPRDISLLTL